VVDAPEPTVEEVDLGLRLVVEPDIGDLYTFCPAPFGEPVEVKDSDYLGLAVALRCTRRVDEEFVRVTGTIRNARPDHRLRMHVPLAFPAQGSVAAAPFELVQRPVASEGGYEAPSPTWPASGAVYAGGTAVLGEGVFEYEVIEGRMLAITLLRCTGSISRPSGMPTRWASAGPLVAAPGGQMLGEWEVSLGIWPNAELDRLLEMRERFALPLLTAPAPGGGDLAASGTLLELERAQLSSVRRREGALEVRVWNPSNEQCRVRVGAQEIELGPARIVTVRQ
jgi:mannosylglycerate hydrolase